MKDFSVIEKIKNGLVVSCQALEGEPLYGSNIMAKVALAAKLGGAVGIRANSVDDIVEIKKEIDLPIIGIIKRNYPDSEIYITPTIKEIEELNEIGVEIIAADFTSRKRPGGISLEEFTETLKAKFPDQLIMADVSTYEEGILAEKLGADIVSTTLSGYTDYSPKFRGPDYELIKRLSRDIRVPVFAEGRIQYPQDAKRALEFGAQTVVVGGAITRPMEITKRFVGTLNSK